MLQCLSVKDYSILTPCPLSLSNIFIEEIYGSSTDELGFCSRLSFFLKYINILIFFPPKTVCIGINYQK